MVSAKTAHGNKDTAIEGFHCRLLQSQCVISLLTLDDEAPASWDVGA